MDILARLGRESESAPRERKLAQLADDAAKLQELLDKEQNDKSNMDLIHEILQLYLKLDLPMEAEVWLRRMEMTDSADVRIIDATEQIRLKQENR
jgi:hypothetical protein